jgi:uncharacterized protein (TIGR02271 family)
MATDRVLTAMYDSRSAAESARDRLVGLGIASDSVGIRGAEAGAATTEAPEERGFWASLFMPAEDQRVYSEGVNRGGYMLSARVPDGMEDEAIDVLENSGAVDLDAQAESWGQAGVVPGAAYAAPAGVAEASTAYRAEPRADARRVEGDEVIQAAEEKLRVGKREVNRGSVRVRSYVTERPVEEQVSLRDETVQVERRPVDREVTAGDDVFKDRTIEAVERDEEAVVSKTARVTEEIGIRKDVDTRTNTVRDTVRKQEIEVEDDRTGGGATDAGLDTTTTRGRPNR